jgi:hypothetical protein
MIFLKIGLEFFTKCNKFLSEIDVSHSIFNVQRCRTLLIYDSSRFQINRKVKNYLLIVFSTWVRITRTFLDWIEFNFEPIIHNSTIRKRISMGICITQDMQLFSSAFKKVKQYSVRLFRQIGLFFFIELNIFIRLIVLWWKSTFSRINCQKLVLLGMHRTVHVRVWVQELYKVVTSVEYRGVTISDRRKSECRWNYTLFDSSNYQLHRLHIKHLLKYPSIRENER